MNKCLLLAYSANQIGPYLCLISDYAKAYPLINVPHDGVFNELRQHTGVQGFSLHRLVASESPLVSLFGRRRGQPVSGDVGRQDSYPFQGDVVPVGQPERRDILTQ